MTSICARMECQMRGWCAYRCDYAPGSAPQPMTNTQLDAIDSVLTKPQRDYLPKITRCGPSRLEAVRQLLRLGIEAHKARWEPPEDRP